MEDGVKKANQGVALALASTPSFSALDKRGRVNVGIGSFEGETAVSASGTYRLKKNRYIYGTVGTAGDATGVSAGFSFGW